MKVNLGYFGVALCQMLLIDTVVEKKIGWGHDLGQTRTRVSHEHQSSTLGSDIKPCVYCAKSCTTCLQIYVLSAL